MFNGIIQQLARVHKVQPTSGGKRLGIEIKIADLKPGSSVAVQGTCLTITHMDRYCWFDLSNATLATTSLKSLTEGNLVNIEPAMKLGDSIDGHLVSGHIDGTGRIHSITQLGDNHRVQIDFPAALAPYFAVKGSACVDGVSLTINQITEQYFIVNIIPFTWQHTCFHQYRQGTRVNLEIDLLARYTVNALNQLHNTSHV